LIEKTERCSTVCRNAKDQPFLDLAQSGKADLLISGDQDLFDPGWAVYVSY
jgi:putative PIN family toxin of toxin-antitoxin system